MVIPGFLEMTRFDFVFVVRIKDVTKTFGFNDVVLESVSIGFDVAVSSTFVVVMFHFRFDLVTTVTGVDVVKTVFGFNVIFFDFDVAATNDFGFDVNTSDFGVDVVTSKTGFNVIPLVFGFDFVKTVFDSDVGFSSVTKTFVVIISVFDDVMSVFGLNVATIVLFSDVTAIAVFDVVPKVCGIDVIASDLGFDVVTSLFDCDVRMTVLTSMFALDIVITGFGFPVVITVVFGFDIVSSFPGFLVFTSNRTSFFGFDVVFSNPDVTSVFGCGVFKFDV